MMGKELYRELILDHSRRPRHFGALADASVRVDGHNAMCGDHLCLYLRLDGVRIAGVSFDGEGCAICVASASLMSEAILGKRADEALALSVAVDAMLREESAPPAPGKLDALSGVRRFASRIPCAQLAWNTLREGLRHHHAQSAPQREATP